MKIKTLENLQNKHAKSDNVELEKLIPENNKSNNKLKTYEKLQEQIDNLELEKMKFEQIKKKEKIR